MKIVFKNVSKDFVSVKALDNVSFTVKSGEFVFLVGPSGAGKTTAFKIIVGETIPDQGEVWVGDQIVFDQGEKIKGKDLVQLRRSIGTIYQDFQLIEEYTVAENIVLALDILSLSKEKKEKEIDRALKKVNLLKRKNDFPRQLSGGELQRLCLARALVMKPKIILADEPTGNLDPEASWQLISLLDKINQEGTTVVMATHNFDIVNSLKRRVIRIEQGKIISDKKKGKY